MAETSTQTLNSTETNERLVIPDKYFRYNTKTLLLVPIIIILVAIIITFGIIIFINYNANENFMQNYRNTVLYNVADRLKEADTTEEISKIIKHTFKNRWVRTLFVCDKTGLLLVHSVDNVTKRLSGKKPGSRYEFIFTHLWQFNPDGTPIPFEKYLEKEISILSSLPVYDETTKKLKYIIVIEFDRFMFAPYLMKYKDFPYYLFFVEIGVAMLVIIIIALLLGIFFLTKNYKKITRNLRYILSNLYKVELKDLPQKIEFNKEGLKNNIVADYINYINELLDKLHQKIEQERERAEELRRVQLPLILKKPFEEPLKVIVKKERVNVPENLWSLYFSDETIKEIQNYSAGFYHFKKAEPTIVFKQIDINPNKKAFFIADIKEKNKYKHPLLLTFLNYFLNTRKENIESTTIYLQNMNNLLYYAGGSELKFDALYAVLNTDTDYIEISSTNISPLILYKADSREAIYYQFEGLQLGEKWSDEFLQKLKKQSFQLSEDDTIVIINNSVESLVNTTGVKYEVNNIVKTIHKQFPAPAEVLIEKIQNSIKDFSPDFSKIDDLAVLVIKRNK